MMKKVFFAMLYSLFFMGCSTPYPTHELAGESHPHGAQTHSYLEFLFEVYTPDEGFDVDTTFQVGCDEDVTFWLKGIALNSVQLTCTEDRPLLNVGQRAFTLEVPELPGRSRSQMMTDDNLSLVIVECSDQFSYCTVRWWLKGQKETFHFTIRD